jgi:hypothetical protein
MADPTPNLVPFDELAPTMQTGDVILMHGVFPESKLIELIEGSIWTHSGTVVRSADIGLSGPNIPDLLFWESNSLTNLPDLILNEGKTGPMLVGLRERIITNVENYYDMEFALKPLKMDRSLVDWGSLRGYINQVHEATFPSDMEMLWMWLKGRDFHIRTPLNQIFCAELVALTYQNWGLLAESDIPNAYAPKDFSDKGHPPLQKGASLEPEIRIAPPTNSPVRTEALSRDAYFKRVLTES